MGRLSGETALITGGTRGIGAAVVRRCVEEGCKVVFTGRNAENGAEIESELRATGGEVAFFRADMTSESEIAASVDRAIRLFGGLSVLVNNAAPIELNAKDNPPHETSVETWNELIRMNLTQSAFTPCKYALPHMMAAGRGSIIQISSTGSQFAGAPLAYSVGKAGANAMMRNLAFAYAPYGIRANAITLGYFPGPSTQGLENLDELFRRNTPLGSGKGEHLGAYVAFLASRDAEWVTGQTITLDGGLTIYLPGAMDGALEARRKARVTG